jgi:ELWxxDGT repeat protein
VKVVSSAEISSNAGAQLTNVNGTLYFTPDDGVHDFSLWQSNGTALGTQLVRIGEAQGLREFEHDLYFQSGNELWRTHDKFNGTYQVAETKKVVALPGPPGLLTNCDGTLYFAANDGPTYTACQELWQTDGSAAGTHLVSDLMPGQEFSLLTTMAVTTNTLYFGQLTSSGYELWRREPFNSEPALVKDIAPGDASSDPQQLTNIKNTLYFTAEETTHGRQLWRTSRVSQGPVISGIGPTATYIENATLTLAGSATISDSDSLDFAGGKLIVELIANARAEDQLAIRKQGGITTLGGSVKYNNVTIGTFYGGTNLKPLIISLNSNASHEATQALLRSITFRTVSETPDMTARKINFTLIDGDGGTSNAPIKTLQILAVNDAPIIGLSGTIAYTHDKPAIMLAPRATLTDYDSSDFYSGELTVKITGGASASNRLAIGGNFKIYPNYGFVTFGGTTIGVVNSGGGQGTTPLKVSFNTYATRSLVQQLIRSITFKTVGGAAGNRSVVFTVSDGDGGTSLAATKIVKVT